MGFEARRASAGGEFGSGSFLIVPRPMTTRAAHYLSIRSPLFLSGPPRSLRSARARGALYPSSAVGADPVAQADRTSFALAALGTIWCAGASFCTTTRPRCVTTAAVPMPATFLARRSRRSSGGIGRCHPQQRSARLHRTVRPSDDVADAARICRGRRSSLWRPPGLELRRVRVRRARRLAFWTAIVAAADSVVRSRVSSLPPRHRRPQFLLGVWRRRSAVGTAPRYRTAGNFRIDLLRRVDGRWRSLRPPGLFAGMRRHDTFGRFLFVADPAFGNFVSSICSVVMSAAVVSLTSSGSSAIATAASTASASGGRPTLQPRPTQRPRDRRKSLRQPRR